MKEELRWSQLITLAIGVIAILIALTMENVLELMLLSYSFMVSGLLVPVLMGVFWKMRNPWAAIASMVGGGTTTILLTFLMKEPPVGLGLKLFFGLDANFYGILISLILFIVVSNIYTDYGTNHSKTDY